MIEKKYYHMRAGTNPFDPAIGAKPLTKKQADGFLLALSIRNFSERMDGKAYPGMREMSAVRNVKRKWRNV